MILLLVTKIWQIQGSYVKFNIIYNVFKLFKSFIYRKCLLGVSHLVGTKEYKVNKTDGSFPGKFSLGLVYMVSYVNNPILNAQYKKLLASRVSLCSQPKVL